MHTCHGLFWEHWNQSRLWIVGAASFLVLMTCGVWLNHDWVMREFRNDPFELDKFAWVVGFTAVCLMFVNYRMREVNLYFPRRQFALPCRTVPLMLSHLVFKSAVAACLGLLIAVYHAVLLEQPFSLLAVELFLALVAMAQALTILATILGPWLTAGAAALAGWVALGGFAVVSNFGPGYDETAIRWTCLGLIVLGWVGALALAPLARRGAVLARGEVAPRFRWRLQAWAPVNIQWTFAGPVSAHAWHEWRRVVCWVPRVVLVCALMSFVVAVTGDEDVALFMLLASGVASGSLGGYFLFRLTPTESRFVLARPGAFHALVDGKLLAAFGGALTTAIAASALVTLLLSLAGLVLRDDDVIAGWIEMLPLFSLGLGAIVWIALTSAPVFMAGTGLWFLFVLLVVAPIAGLAGVFLPLGWIAGTVVLMAVVLGLRHLARRGIPVPWELSLVALAFLPNALVWWISGDVWTFERTPLPFRAQLELFSPILLLWGGLLFAYRVGAIGWRRLERAILVHLFLVLLLAVAILLMSRTLDDMKDKFFLFWWLAACFGPFVWLPLSLHGQRYRWACGPIVLTTGNFHAVRRTGAEEKFATDY